ncbi:BURP domain containing protein [Parasponia andersonii]|uniref:BURP domain containing protein n=1 Tax=Parasponia andersonii TaxID=3476 RepID=A0A2P5B048_PARAD|nr:BURP domain containing protein [Parasponia andersonii]
MHIWQLTLLLRSYALERVDWEPYWHSILPNFHFPIALRNVLQPANLSEGQYNYFNTGKEALIYVPNANRKYRVAYKRSFPGKLAEVQGGDQGTYFVRKDLQEGQKMKLDFPKSQIKAKYLPRKVTESIPFSSNKLPEILNRFGIKPKSIQAELVKETIEECEEQAFEGEDKFCATSPESLIDFGVSKIGKKVKVFTTEVDKETKPQDYNVKGVEKIGDKSVVCHKINYVYGVFYCHEIQATKAFMVSLVGSDGTKAKAVALCHYDTKLWNPQHLAFQMLKVKPGTVPICHFLSRGNLVWVPI